MKFKTARDRLFFFLWLIIVLPLLQYHFHFIESGKLMGVDVVHNNVKFSIAKWWGGAYQKQKEEYLNDSIGFRPDLVRLNNQLDFWMFKKLHAGDVFVGPGNFLSSKMHTDEYFGITQLQPDDIRDKLIKFKMVQDTMQRIGKTLIFGIAPSKPYLYPDKIPRCLYPNETHKTNNYSMFKRMSDSLKINQVDFNGWFMAMRDTSSGILMSKQGIHWSIYGSLLAADSLIKYIERERKIKMPELQITKMNYTTKYQGKDDDLGQISNLVFPLATENMNYPDYHYASDGATSKPKTIYIGDSFLWLWKDDGLMDNTNEDYEFWSYFNDIRTKSTFEGRGSVVNIDQYNWQQQLMNADCVVFLYTPMNFHHFNYAVNTIYHYFYPERK